MDEQKIGACGDEVEHEDGSRLLTAQVFNGPPPIIHDVP
jgi:hypothetical protein